MKIYPFARAYIHSYSQKGPALQQSLLAAPLVGGVVYILLSVAAAAFGGPAVQDDGSSNESPRKLLSLPDLPVASFSDPSASFPDADPNVQHI